MLFHKEEAMLFCMHCQKETLHQINYVNQTISSIQCKKCQNTLSIDINAMSEFHHYLYERLVSKPGRMSEEARKDLSKFLASLPMRIISKPIRFSNEYSQLNKEVKVLMDEKNDQKNQTKEALDEADEPHH